MNRKFILFHSINLSVLISLISIFSVTAVSAELLSQDAIRDSAQEFVNSKLPENIQLKYSESDEDGGNAWVIEYGYDSSKDWELKPKKKGTSYDFGGSGYAFSIEGNYAFSDDKNYKDYSSVNGSYKKRWFNIEAESPVLTLEQQAIVDECLRQSSDFSVTVDDCRKKHKFSVTELTHVYVDADMHIKVDGDQSYDDRNYAYGVELKLSGKPHSDSWMHALNIFEYPGRLMREQEIVYRQLPVLTIGLEQVDPKDNESRLSLGVNDDVYERVYMEISHTSPLGSIKGYPFKLNLNWKYFEEIDAPDVVKSSNQDKYTHYTIAFQFPSAIIPSFETDKSSFIVSYSSGELPFGRGDDKVFEIGWQTNVDFNKLFTP